MKYAYNKPANEFNAKTFNAVFSEWPKNTRAEKKASAQASWQAALVEYNDAELLKGCEEYMRRFKDITYQMFFPMHLSTFLKEHLESYLAELAAKPSEVDKEWYDATYNRYPNFEKKAIIKDDLFLFYSNHIKLEQRYFFLCAVESYRKDVTEKRNSEIAEVMKDRANRFVMAFNNFMPMELWKLYLTTHAGAKYAQDFHRELRVVLSKKWPLLSPTVIDSVGARYRFYINPSEEARIQFNLPSDGIPLTLRNSLFMVIKSIFNANNNDDFSAKIEIDDSEIKGVAEQLLNTVLPQVLSNSMKVFKKIPDGHGLVGTSEASADKVASH